MRPRSIGFRLSLAFLGVSALFLISGIVTWAILQRVTENQMVIGNKAIPALQAVQEISELAASIVTESPLLTEAQTDAERSRRWMSTRGACRHPSGSYAHSAAAGAARVHERFFIGTPGVRRGVPDNVCHVGIAIAATAPAT